MSVKLYFDVHVPRSIARALRSRGADVLTAQEDDARQLSDAELLDRASSLDRLLFSRDEDLLREATKRQRTGVPFSGLAYGHQLKVTIGQCVRDLELIAIAGDLVEFRNQVIYLPLR